MPEDLLLEADCRLHLAVTEVIDERLVVTVVCVDERGTVRRHITPKIRLGRICEWRPEIVLSNPRYAGRPTPGRASRETRVAA